MTFVSFAILAAAVLGLGWYLTQAVLEFSRTRFDQGVLQLRYAVFVLGGYLVLLFGLSLASRSPEVPSGHARCFGDWCATIAEPFFRDGQISATVTIHNKGSRAVRPSNPLIYAVDSRRRSAGPGREEGPPLDQTLQPGETITKQYSFYVPPDSEELRIVIQQGNWLSRLAPGHENAFFHGRPGTPVGR